MWFPQVGTPIYTFADGKDFAISDAPKELAPVPEIVCIDEILSKDKALQRLPNRIVQPSWRKSASPVVGAYWMLLSTSEHIF